MNDHYARLAVCDACGNHFLPGDEWCYHSRLNSYVHWDCTQDVRGEDISDHTMIFGNLETDENIQKYYALGRKSELGFEDETQKTFEDFKAKFSSWLVAHDAEVERKARRQALWDASEAAHNYSKNAEDAILDLRAIENNPRVSAAIKAAHAGDASKAVELNWRDE